MVPLKEAISRFVAETLRKHYQEYLRIIDGYHLLTSDYDLSGSL
jgi:hypothetical protein